MGEQYFSTPYEDSMEKVAVNPGTVFTASRNAGRFGNFLSRRKANKNRVHGTFRNNPADSEVTPGNVNWFSGSDIAKNELDQLGDATTGSLAADGGLWLTKLVAKPAREPIRKGKQTFLGTINQFDQKGGEFVTRGNPDSFIGGMFSKDVKVPVANEVRPDGTTSTLFKDERRSSLFAPVEKTTKFLTPWLAGAFVADKLYGDEETNNQQINKQSSSQEFEGEGSNQATYEQDTEKTSFRGNNLFDDYIVAKMEKQASMQKIAELEDSLRKYANDLQHLMMEKTAIEKRLESALEENLQLEKRASLAEEELTQEKVAFEELRLRTIAQKRSKVAIDLAEEMLDKGLIKQAEFQGTVDTLMEADEKTMKMHKNLLKEASSRSESLESLSFLGEYKTNNKLADSSSFANLGLSKKGQSIGEAARELSK